MDSRLLFVIVGFSRLLLLSAAREEHGEFPEQHAVSDSGADEAGAGRPGGLSSGVRAVRRRVFIPVCGVPVYRICQAKQWRLTPCTILESRLESSSDSDGTTYRFLVRYEYVFDGRKYVGDRYNFALGSSGGHDSKLRLVQSLPPGRRVTCWVDPAKPWISVIDRTPPGDLWFGLFPVVFVAIGGALMFAGEVGF